jgi:hypothetical protein
LKEWLICSWSRQHDLELLRLHLALQAALKVAEHAAAMGGGGTAHQQPAEAALEEAAQHMAAVGDPWKKVGPHLDSTSKETGEPLFSLVHFTACTPIARPWVAHLVIEYWLVNTNGY